MLPGPGAYEQKREMGTNMQYAKSMLGGSLEDKPLEESDTPGPNAYDQNPLHSIAGFVIM
jgi:hypothetical protein